MLYFICIGLCKYFYSLKKEYIVVKKKFKYLNRAPKIAYCKYDTMKSIIPREKFTL